jgi:hypothetical protein
MFCTKCGTSIPANQAVCPQCGQFIAPVATPVPGMAFELENYRSQIKVLAIAWFVYGGLSLLLGIAGLSFARHIFMGGLGPWAQGPWAHGPWMTGQMPPFLLPMVMGSLWVFIIIRSLFAFLVGWGLLEPTRWGRILAIVFAVLSLFRFPLGTALGIWTLVTLLGYRHSVLYEQL